MCKKKKKLNSPLQKVRQEKTRRLKKETSTEKGKGKAE